MLKFLILTGGFITIASLVVWLEHTLFASRLAVLERLQGSTDVSRAAPGDSGETGKGDLKETLLSFLALLGRALPRRYFFRNIQQKLVQAHIFLRAEELVGLAVVLGAGLFLLVYLLSESWILALAGGLLGLKAPDLYVERKKNKRMQILNQQLPEALSIMSNGLRAGYSFPQAMEVVSREMEPPIAQEFGRVIMENRLGKPMEEALLDLSTRTDNEDIDLAVTAMLIQRQVGGNLAEILDKIEHTIRERVRIKGQIRVMTAQQRFSAMIVLLLPPGMFAIIYVMNPDYILTLVREPIGYLLLGAALLLQIIGVFIISRIVNIEV